MTPRPRPGLGAEEVSDLELMAYADGELESHRRAVVDALLARDATATAKLRGLIEVASILKASASGPSSSSAIAESVMAAIEREPPPRRAAETATIRRIDGARTYYVVAALVAAAAALGLVWTQLDAGSERAAAGVRAPSAAASSAPAAVADGAHEHGVEVWSVDFGSASGAVFYVPNATSPSDTTTVVWVSDEEANGGEEE